MQTELKNRILDYLRKTAGDPANTELEEERKELIKKMETEVCFVDINTHSICVEDLETYDTEELREKLGKEEGEEYTMDDCEKVSCALAEYICEDFSEDLSNAITYELS